MFWSFQIVMLEKTLENSLDCKEIKPVHLKGNLPWIFIGRTDGKAEAPVLWSLYVTSGLIGKDPDAGKYWRQKEKGATEDAVVRQHHRLSAHEFEQTPGDSAGQSSLACCSPWGCRVRLNLVMEQQKMKSSPENSPVSCSTHSRWTDKHREADGSASREIWGIRKVPLDLMR